MATQKEAMMSDRMYGRTTIGEVGLLDDEFDDARAEELRKAALNAAFAVINMSGDEQVESHELLKRILYTADQIFGFYEGTGDGATD